MTSAGKLYPATDVNSAYISRKDHRPFATSNRNRWATRVSPDSEYVIFCEAETNNWTDQRPHLWGVEQGLVELGTNGERIAKFPHRQNPQDAAHGYPVSALDPKREIEHRPQPPLVRRWREADLIDDVQAARINRGKI